MRFTLPASVLGVILLASCQTQPAPESRPEQDALVIGDTFSIESAVLGESRRINVYAPAAYADADSLPVLYMPDGGLAEDFLHVAGLVQISALNGTMSPHLLVGIENTERRRDLTGPTSVESDREIAPRVGGSGLFRAFIRDELMPVVRQRYRTTGETAIVGESLAGLFVVETLMEEPSLFDTYIAIDPSVWWDGARLVEALPARIRGFGGSPVTLYAATSSQPDIAELTLTMVEILTSEDPEALHLEYRHYPEETHGTIYHPAALAAFRTVLAPGSP